MQPQRQLMQLIYCEGPFDDIEGWVSKDADLDGIFYLTDEFGETWKVSGWNVRITVIH